MNEEAKFCPFCGERIGEWLGDGKSICEKCGAKFYVEEADDSERNAAKWE